jgi:hypothetical protein
MRRILMILFPGLLLSGICFSQTEGTNIVEDVTENISESLQESGQSDLPEELTKLASDKVDLNSDEIDMLLIAGLITKQQCNAVKTHIEKYGRLIEMEELQQVKELDKATIFRILPYSALYTKKEIQSRSTLTIRYQQSLIPVTNYYEGSLSKIMTRFRTTINSSFSAGLTFEKDEGEQMFTKENPAFDFNSFHVIYNGNKIIKKIIAGDYNIEFGQGLNAWSGISFGGTSTVTSIFKSARGIVPYTGTDENRFFRGIAIGMQKNNLRLDVWISHHGVDANVYRDSITDVEYVTSLQFTGYHRDFSETRNYHSVAQSSAGLHLQYKIKRAEIGFVSSTQKFNLPIEGSGRDYARFSFKGLTNSVNGFYYSYSFHNIILFGEESFSQNKSFASLNGLIISADPRFAFGLLYRNYPYDYQNLKSNAFGVNSTNSNENGIYLTFNYSILRTISYSASINIYKFPFLKYQIDGPSKGQDVFHQIDYKPNKKFTAQIRYRSRIKEESLPTYDSNVFSNNNYESLRLSSVIKIDKDWTYGMRIELMRLRIDEKVLANGSMISQDIFYKPMGKRYSFNIRYAIFNCPQFETRIYEFENDVQGAFSVPFYYGNGSRFYINTNLRLSRRINLSIRYSKTWQEDEKFDGKSDIKIQLRVNL